MSLDDQVTVNMGSDDSPPPSGRGKKSWIPGGCGCLALLAVLFIAGWIWFAVNQYNQLKQEAKSFVEISSVVQQKLGSPVTIEGDRPGNGPDGMPMFEFDVSGPSGSGTVSATTGVDQKAGGLVITKYVLTFDGEEIDLNQEDDLGIDIEGLDDF